MAWIDAFIPVEERNRQLVMADTWGHLCPEKDRVYRGHITWALGCLGSDHLNPTILQLTMGDLTSSPWLYEWLQDVLGDYSDCRGAVYRFDGQFCNYRLKGYIRRIVLTPPRKKHASRIYSRKRPRGEPVMQATFNH